MKKRVLLNASMVTKDATGVGVYSIQLLKKLVPILQSNNIDFTIYTYQPSAFPFQKGITKITLGFFLDRIFKKNTSIHRQIWNTFFLHVVAYKFNMVYSPSSHGTLFHKNQIITIHDLISLAYPKQHKGQHIYFKNFVPHLINKSKCIITITHFTKAEVLKFYNGVTEKKLVTIYNGVNHRHELKVSDESKMKITEITGENPFCLMVGAGYKHKNLDTIIQVANELRHTNIKIVVVGKPNAYYEDMQKKATALHSGNLIFLDYVDDNLLAALYKATFLNLYISLYEGFGFPPAEALFFGANSLLSSQKALLEVYGGFFDFVDPLDIHSICSKILEHVNKPFDKKDLFEKLKAKYNWEKSAMAVFQLIDRQL